MDLMGVYRVLTACLFLLTCQLCSGVPVGRIEMGSAHRFLQGGDAILPCRFHGKPIAVYWDLEGIGQLIAWFANGDSFPKIDNKRIDILDDFSLTIKNLTASDAGRYLCKVSDFRGYLIWNKTDLQVAVPPSDPFPKIDTFTISEGNQRTPITCRANGASIGFVDLQWMHNGNEYPQIIRNLTNADGITENLTATIEALVSEEPYICVGTLNATNRVNSTKEAFVQRTIFSTIPSEEEPTEYLTTPIEDTDNNHSTVIAVAVSVSILLALTVIAVFAAVYICLKKKKLPIRPLQLYKILQKEGRRRGDPEAKFQQGVNDVGSQGEASVTLMTPR